MARMAVESSAIRIVLVLTVGPFRMAVAQVCPIPWQCPSIAMPQRFITAAAGGKT